MHRAARNSLYDLMYKHAGSSLFMRPIFWTKQHCDVLGVCFHELPPCNTPVPPPGVYFRETFHPSHTLMTLGTALDELVMPVPGSQMMSANAAKVTLEILWPNAFPKAQFLPDLHLFFGGRVYRAAVHVQVMWNFSSDVWELCDSFRSVSTQPAKSFGHIPAPSSAVHNTAGLPMMCFLAKNQLAAMRKSMFRVGRGPNRSFNDPVARLQQLRCKTLLPPNDDHDAHLVGIFLAMAQRHFYGLPPPLSRREHAWEPRGNLTFHDLKLRILTQDTDTVEFIIYTATVTAQFLQRFHDPFNTPKDESGKVPGLDIQLTRVPIWPILGLRERMGKALGHDIVGPFDPTEARWGDSDSSDSDVTTATVSSKRARGTLDEVLNESLDGGDTTDEASSPEMARAAKRRRLRQGSAVGVVI